MLSNLFFGAMVSILGVFALAMYAISIVDRHNETRVQKRAATVKAMQRIRHVSGAIPAQFMSVELKKFLLKVELALAGQLRALGDRSARRDTQIKGLVEALASPEEEMRENRRRPVTNEVVAVDVRNKLKAVNRVIRYAADERLCTVDELQRWTGVITRLGIMVNIELYTGQALREMNAGNPRKAVLTIERGIDYLERIPNSAQYKVELDQFAAALERARKEVEILDAEERAGAGCVLSEAVDRMLADDSESLIKAY